MFSRMQLVTDTETVAERFNTTMVTNPKHFSPKEEINGFAHDFHPVLLKINGLLVLNCFRWGLVPPDWKKEPEKIWNHTISAKLEYINKRYAWQKVSQNRCLIPATAYFEYHWDDLKGNSKTKFIIKHITQHIFSLAGFYSIWSDSSGNNLQTFTVCTTKANEIMQYVHNKDADKNYHRMPVMLNKNDETTWLDTTIPCMDFAYPNYQPNLTANPIEKTLSGQLQLF